MEDNTVMAKLGGFLFGGLLFGGGGLLLGILLGALAVGGYGYFSTGGVNIPYDTVHTNIANGFQVTDMTDSAGLTLRHMMTGSATYHPFASQDVFVAGQSYTQSLWVFEADGDIDITMTIWGPGEGDTYSVEFGRHAGNTIQIKGWGFTFSFPSGSNVGYASCSVVAK